MLRGMIVEVPEPRPPAVTITLLAGFLGAGKTTVLNHLVREAPAGSRLGVLVNDFGAINIDAELVAAVDGETITLQNGCICCTIKDDLLLSLFRLLRRPDAPAHVLIEASGVSDPAEVLKSFDDARMFDIVRLASVVVVVDAEQYAAVEYRDQPLALHQLLVADLVILNKLDLLDAAATEAIIHKVRATAPDVRLIRAIYGRAPVELVLGVGRFDLDRALRRIDDAPGATLHVHDADSDAHAHAHADSGRLDHELVYARWSYSSPRALALPALREFLDTLPPAIYRAKGIVELADDARRVIVQVVGKRVELTRDEPWGDGEVRVSKLVAIGRAGDFDPDALTAAIEDCAAPSTNSRRASQALAGGVRGWIRSLWPRSSS